MKNATDLFRALQATAPFQPATNYWRAVELDAVQRHGLPAGRGLDLGCGDGKLTRIIDDALGAAPARTWVGLDVDPQETGIADVSGLYEVVHTASATSIPEPDAAFDFVFSNSVLEHIPPIDAVLAEAGRVLRLGGKFVATVPAAGFHSLLSGPILGGDRGSYHSRIDARCAHLRYWGVDDWRRELAEAGMELTSAVGYLSGRQVRTWERLSAVTGGLLHALSGRRRRPIELQRALGLRGSRPGPVGRLVAATSSVALASLPMAATNETGPFGCLLVEAVRR